MCQLSCCGLSALDGLVGCRRAMTEGFKGPGHRIILYKGYHPPVTLWSLGPRNYNGETNGT